MEIIKKYEIKHDDPLYHIGFENYTNKSGDFYFFVGQAIYDERRNGNINNFLKFDKKWVGLTLEEPNFCTHSSLPGDEQHTNILKRFDKILTIDQSIADVYKNRVSVFFPFNETYINNPQIKIYDVIYTGSLGYEYFENIVNAISNFKYVCVSTSDNPLVTHKHVNYQTKLDLISKSKITILHNLVFVSPHDIPRYKGFPHYNKIESFKHIDKGILPQIKSRTFEAAFSRSLMLCQYDQFNVIEKFFEPNKHFLYFKTFDEMQDIIRDVIENYSKYQEMIDNAFEKAVNNYTTKIFVEKYLQ
jgi:hypothetical protein